MEKIKEISGEIFDRHLKYCKNMIEEPLKKLIEKEEKKPKARKNLILDYKIIDGEAIEQLIRAKPDEMLKLSDRFIKEFKTVTGKKTIFNLFLTAYKSFTNTNTKGWGAYQYLKSLEVNLCPYCNENYTYSLLDKNKTRAGYPNLTVRADLDHFFPKNTYQLLAMSLYNLVPSCKICNSSIKGSKEFDLTKKPLNPYIESLDSQVKFIRKAKSNVNHVDVLLGHSIDFDFDIIEQVTADKYSSAEYMIDFFGIKDRYNLQHKEYIQRQVKREVVYDEVLKNKMNSLLEGMDVSVDDAHVIDRYIINNQSLGKLLNDSFGEVRNY